MHVIILWARDRTCVRLQLEDMDNQEGATKIKEAIDLLSSALGESTTVTTLAVIA